MAGVVEDTGWNMPAGGSGLATLGAGSGRVADTAPLGLERRTGRGPAGECWLVENMVMTAGAACQQAPSGGNQAREGEWVPISVEGVPGVS